MIFDKNDLDGKILDYHHILICLSIAYYEFLDFNAQAKLPNLWLSLKIYL